MRLALLFTLPLGVTLGCSGGAANPPPTVPVRVPPPIDAAPIDAPPPVPIARGGACRPTDTCAPGLACLSSELAMPGGACVSRCGLTGSACDDGACVATAHAGELCLATCTSDADCRAAEGYVCDPTWHACLIPNVAVIAPRTCPAPAAAPRDRAFAPSTQLSTAALPGVFQTSPTATLTSDGSLLALFTSRGGPGDTSLLGSARTGARAAIDLPFAPGGGAHAEPWLARDRKGVLYAVWLAAGDAEHAGAIELARSRDDGRTWTAPSAVHDPADCDADPRACLARPMIVVGPDPADKQRDLVYVIYAAQDGLRVRPSYDEGVTFRTTVTAVPGNTGNAIVGADGRLHVIALHGGPTTGGYGSANHAIEYAVSTDGGRRFSSPQPLQRRDERLPFFFANPSLAVDTSRRWLYAAYVRGGRDAVWDLVVLASKDAGKSWKRVRIGDAPSCAIHMVPNLALDPATGTLHLAWYDSRGGGRFAHATCTPGLASCTQQGAINDRPFAALSTERDAPRWVGDAEALVIDSKRRTLHAVWAQPVDEGGRIVSRIFHATAKLPKR